jgi:hypothetical protein
MRHSTVSSQRSRFVLIVVVGLLLATLACGFQGGAFGSTPTPPASNQILVPMVGSGAAAQSPATASEPALIGVTPLAVSAAPASGETADSILIAAPSAGQSLRGSFHVEGLADPALEQQLYVLVRDARGSVIAAGRPSVQSQAGQRGKFSAEVPLPADLSPQVGRVIVYAISPRDSGITHLSSVDVQLNGDGQPAAPIDPATPEGITITFPNPGAEVKGAVKVAAATMLGPKVIVEVRDANDKTVGRVEQPVEQIAGQPAQVLVEVPIQVSAAQPGRVLVYTLNPRDGQTEHLNSVEVNLVP